MIVQGASTFVPKLCHLPIFPTKSDTTGKQEKPSIRQISKSLSGQHPLTCRTQSYEGFFPLIISVLYQILVLFLYRYGPCAL
ncbi:hypothetical protein K1719_035829 [Acacia pycnantha]|nr:hypothetical protein K1719_035760 [Acacia pycnantha]KAI9082406.1 hypothetical protein K1719_035829 [Acacia pycnantha]